MGTIRTLEMVNAHLREQNAQLAARNAFLEEEHRQQQARMEVLEARIVVLEQRLGKDSQNSHKPPASDGLRRRPRSERKPSQRPQGGPIGHQGHTLDLVATPEVVVHHHPSQCAHCTRDLSQTPGQVLERRQVFDLPPLRMQVTEHQVVRVQCPHCGQATDGVFPPTVSGRTQYGPELRALAVYLRIQQLLPVERTAEVLTAMTRQPIAEASILSWEQAASTAAVFPLEGVRLALQREPVLHADETGGRIGKTLHWVHVHSTRLLTLFGWHAQRGREGSGSLGVLEHFHQTLVHDRWESYWQFACRHALCHAHLQRDLQAVYEATPDAWVLDLKTLFLDMHQATEEWRVRGPMPAEERTTWETAFWRLVERGEAAHPIQPGTKQSEATNLLRALREHSDEVLAFLRDLQVPFTNNQAEQDVRMVKVQQKVAGCWRTEDGATAFCRLRSVISCVRKRGRDILDALSSLVTGRPLSLLPLCG